jgi:hypothetical protein
VQFGGQQGILPGRGDPRRGHRRRLSHRRPTLSVPGNSQPRHRVRPL